MSFAQEFRVDEFRARELFVDRNSHEETRALAREVLRMESADYAAAFKGSAIKRAKLWMLQSNACVMLDHLAPCGHSCTSLRSASRLRSASGLGDTLPDTAFTNASSRL